MIHLNNDWDTLLQDEFTKPYYQQLRTFLKTEYQTQTIYPKMENIFNALKKTPYSAVKAVILGQDPYHGVGQAHGLCFSVESGIDHPPSLQNIFKELSADLGTPLRRDGNLTDWAEQGILLLNTVLTVRSAQPASHKGKGWESFTDRIIELLDQRNEPIVFLLWGAHAQAKTMLIHNDRHYILKAPHPSPLSAHRGFFGCGHFSKTNQFLVNCGMDAIKFG